MVANSPGILPKAALLGSKAIYYPFTIPTKLNESATKVGEANHRRVKNVTAGIGGAMASLEPRGPAKWLVGLLAKVHGSVERSEQIAARNKAVFWDPFANGTEQVGRAIAGPGAYWYAKKSGIEQPGADAIYGALNVGGFFHFPTAEEMAASKAPVTTPGSVPGKGEAGGGDAAGAVEAAAQQAPPEQQPAPQQAAAEGAAQVVAA